MWHDVVSFGILNGLTGIRYFYTCSDLSGQYLRSEYAGSSMVFFGTHLESLFFGFNRNLYGFCYFYIVELFLLNVM